MKVETSLGGRGTLHVVLGKVWNLIDREETENV
jgi:hypothetical protein